MFLLTILSVLLSSLPFVKPSENTVKRSDNRPIFLLAGDSTTAAQSCCGGGWGNGFLTTLHNGALGSNYGKNGATTVTYVADGIWADVLESVSRYKKDYTPYVTIAFGHNDKVVIGLAEYARNLKHMALDVHSAGGYPIFVTPLSNRRYDGGSNRVIEDLAEHRLAMLSVASSLPSGSAFVVDLNLASTTYLNRIGERNARLYDLYPSDATHLTKAGSLVFGNMVSGLMDEAMGGSARGGGVERYTSPNETIWEAIEEGRFILPAVGEEGVRPVMVGEL